MFFGTIAATTITTTGCDDAASALCGDCGTIANGDATISGNAELDGIFKAVGTLKMSTGSINADFDARVKNLAAVFDIDVTGKSTAKLVAEIKGEFAAQITAHLDGGIEVDYVEPKCSADISVSASASAQCEAKAGCNVDVDAECDPGELSFKCEGKCSGGCSAECKGTCSVKVEAEGGCTGTCTGSCDLSVTPGVCEGTCKGTCSGDCTLTNAAGECEGECNGDCTGTCELPSAGGSCSGSCKGECKMELTAEAKCEGTCEGSCSGECTGGCEGKFDPPSCDVNASASCEASADCKAQAEAQASASFKCTPPSIDIAYKFSAGLDASAKAEVIAKLDAFKVEMIGIVKGMVELKGLIEGNASLGIEPPVVTIGVAVQNFTKAIASGKFEIKAVALLPCAKDAFVETTKVLTGLPTKMAGTIKAQVELFTLLDL